MSERVTITRVEDLKRLGAIRYVLALDGVTLLSGSDPNVVELCARAVGSALEALGRAGHVACASGTDWPPPVPTGPLIVLFLSPPAARQIAATLGEHSTYPNIVHHLRRLADVLEPDGTARPGPWWMNHAPVPKAWCDAIGASS